MNDAVSYRERITSSKTTKLFIALTFVFLIFAILRITTRGVDTLAWIFLFISGLFLFYVLNFRVLDIQITSDYVRLAFGIFHWTIPMSNIASCQHDDLPWLMKNGGAGIHFMLIENRYRASFNFLEYPRVVIALKQKIGPVRDISFTTRKPDELIELINAGIFSD